MVLSYTVIFLFLVFFFFSSRRRHTRFDCDWSSDVCSSDLLELFTAIAEGKQTAEDIGARCKASARGTRILCDFLVVHGLLTKHANRYARSEERRVGKECRSRWSPYH